jgi:hypothetical protein
MAIGRPAVATQGGANNLDAYVNATDGHIYHRYKAGTGPWSGYDDMGFGPWNTDPAATSWGPGSAILIAGLPGATQLQMRQFSGGAWGSWSTLPTTSPAMLDQTSPAVVSWGSGDIHVFVHNVNNGISMIQFANGNWGSWSAIPPATPTGVTFTDNPTAASQIAAAFDIFINSADGRIWHTYYSNGWAGGWDNPVSGALLGTSPAASSWGAGRVDVVFKAATTVLTGVYGTLSWEHFSNGTWNGPFQIGGLSNSSPAMVSPAVNRIDVLQLGTDGGLWHRFMQ